jgi:hypothetical protein
VPAFFHGTPGDSPACAGSAQLIEMESISFRQAVLRFTSAAATEYQTGR